MGYDKTNRIRFLLGYGNIVWYDFYKYPYDGNKWIVELDGKFYHIIHDGTNKECSYSNALQKITEEEAKQILSKNETKWAEAIMMHWGWEFLDRYLERTGNKCPKIDSGDNEAQVTQEDKIVSEEGLRRYNEESRMAYEIYEKSREKMIKIEELLNLQDELICDLLKLMSSCEIITKEEFAKQIKEIRNKYALFKSSKINQEEEKE